MEFVASKAAHRNFGPAETSSLKRLMRFSFGRKFHASTVLELLILSVCFNESSAFLLIPMMTGLADAAFVLEGRVQWKELTSMSLQSFLVSRSL